MAAAANSQAASKIIALHVGHFRRDDGQLPPESSYPASKVFGLREPDGKNDACKYVHQLKMTDYARSHDRYFSVSVLAHHQFLVFPFTPTYNRGWNGNFAADVKVELQNGEILPIGKIVFVCFSNEGECDRTRGQKDHFDASEQAKAMGFRRGDVAFNVHVEYVVCPPAGVALAGAAASPTISKRGRSDLDFDDRPPVYVPIADYVTGFAPKKSCGAYITEDARALLLPQVPQLDAIVEQCAQITQSKLETGVAPPMLTPPQLFAIVVYTFDIAMISPNLLYEQNFFCVVNKILQERNVPKLNTLSGYLHFLMGGLQALPPHRGAVYRGLKASAMPTVHKHYAQVTNRVHWSGLSSMSESFDFARMMAGHGGVVFKLSVRTAARKLGEASALPREQEVLCLPNFAAVVMSEMKHDAASGILTIELHEAEKKATHVF